MGDSVRPVVPTPITRGSVQVQQPPPEEDAWVRASERLRPQWQSLKAGSRRISISVSISRVNQFDAERLDVEMSAMLKEELVKVFSLMKFSIWVDKPTPGIALMNLSCSQTGLEGLGLTVAQKIWYYISSVGGQYVWARIQSFSAFRRWGDTNQGSLARWTWIFVQHIEGLYKAASFGNLLLFLYTGRYRNLIERALKAMLVYDSPNMNRAVNFEYMNRQLVWNEISEILLLLLPLLNSSTLRNILRPFSKDRDKHSAADDSACPVCQNSPSIPFLAIPCQHRYCDYCLRTGPYVPLPKMQRTGCFHAATQRVNQRYYLLEMIHCDKSVDSYSNVCKFLFRNPSFNPAEKGLVGQMLGYVHH